MEASECALAHHPLQIWSKSSSTEASPVSRNPGWLLRAQTWPRTCRRALVCAAHTFILVLLFKTLSTRNQESPQSMWPIYIILTLNTARTDQPPPHPHPHPRGGEQTFSLGFRSSERTVSPSADRRREDRARLLDAPQGRR